MLGAVLPTELNTPAALVDLDVVERNCARMGERMATLGVRLRPHVKTHKTVEGALMQCGGRPGPITISTLAEARFFLAAGFTDMIYAVPTAPAKLDTAVELIRRGARLHLLVDHEATIAAASRCATEGRETLSLFLKVDCGSHRAGVDPAGDEAERLAHAITASPGLSLAGILTHAGHAYQCRNPREIATVARHERDVMVRLAERLRADGTEIPEVSVGSTPTMSVVDDLTGVTEARPGNYAFFDAFQVAIGACRLEDCAYTVATTVIGCYPDQRRLVVDAGALAFSKDLGARHMDEEFGYGTVMSSDMTTRLWELRVTALSQEHGQVVVNPPRHAAEFPIGTVLRIVPNHSCLSAALFDAYTTLRGGAVVGQWRPVRGW